MREIIEHPDKGNDDRQAVRVGDADSRVPIQVYQDVYHQVTGRTEQIRQRYSQNLLVEFSEIEQLHYKIMQLCDVHNVIAQNEVVSVFHDKERKEQFTSFARFRTYNANASSPSVNVVLKYNFSLVPAGLDRPQEYVVTIRLTSRVAMMRQLQNEAPPFIRPHLFAMVVDTTAEVTIDYADYIVARGFLEAFDEWIRGCKTAPNLPWLQLARRWSHLIPILGRIVVAGLVMWFALQAVPSFFSSGSAPERWARFLVIYTGGAFILVTLMGKAGEMLEEAIDGYPILSYLKLNKGDSNLIDEFSRTRRMVLIRFAVGAVFSIVLGIISSKLEKLV